MSPNSNDDQILTEPKYDFINQYASNYDENTFSLINHHMTNNNKCEYTSVDDLSKKMNSNNKLSLLNLNIQSLKAHWSELKIFINDFSSNKTHFNIIGLTEVFTIAPNTHFALEGYHPLISRSRPPENGKRGGVGPFIDENYLITERNDLGIFIPHVIESVFIEVQRHKSERPIIIGTIYRPNSPPKQTLLNVSK